MKKLKSFSVIRISVMLTVCFALNAIVIWGLRVSPSFIMPADSNSSSGGNVSASRYSMHYSLGGSSALGNSTCANFEISGGYVRQIDTHGPVTTPIPTAIPLAKPFVMGAGYWEFPEVSGGTLSFQAYIYDADGPADIATVNVCYCGGATGLTMEDDGLHDDFAVGDGIYGYYAGIGALPRPVQLLLEIAVFDRIGNESWHWPYLTVTSGISPGPLPVHGAKGEGKKKKRWAPTPFSSDITFSHSNTVGYRPEIKFAGYIDTEITTVQGGVLNMLAVVYDPDGVADIASVELYYQGFGTGVLLNDIDDRGNYVTYGLIASVGSGIPAGQYLLELVATDHSGNLSKMWPYLIIE